jgi:hypothetical protein
VLAAQKAEPWFKHCTTRKTTLPTTMNGTLVPEERRDNRTNSDTSQVQSIIQGKRPMIGGDFVVNEHYDAVTLSFGFKGRTTV